MPCQDEVSAVRSVKNEVYPVFCRRAGRFSNVLGRGSLRRKTRFARFVVENEVYPENKKPVASVQTVQDSLGDSEVQRPRCPDFVSVRPRSVVLAAVQFVRL